MHASPSPCRRMRIWTIPAAHGCATALTGVKETAARCLERPAGNGAGAQKGETMIDDAGRHEGCRPDMDATTAPQDDSAVLRISPAPRAAAEGGEADAPDGPAGETTVLAPKSRQFIRCRSTFPTEDRKSSVEGTGVSERGDPGGGGYCKNTN